jgi:hypothetical protein
MARALCAEIEREDEALFREHVVGRLEYDTGVGYECAGYGVKGADLVHVVE